MERSPIVKPSAGDGRRIVLESSPFDSLPEDCISKIISFTSPREACIAASISKTFKSAAKSHIVWERFITPEIQPLIPRSRYHLSKKDLYFSLCNDPVLFENGQKSLWLEKASGKSCIMLSAKKLAITWGDAPEYWTYFPIFESKFETVALLLHVCWFEIRGRTNTRFLSPKTRYSVYIVFKKADQGHGFKDVPIKAEVGVVGQEASRRYVCFDKEENAEEKERMNLLKPEDRGDGWWMEVELGEFFNEGGLMKNDEIEMSALEIEDLNWKQGLVIEGIEIRPAK